MTRWTDRLLTALGRRKPTAEVSQDPAEREPGPAQTSLRATGGSQEPGSRPVRRTAGDRRPSAPTPDDVIAVIGPQHEHVKTLLKAVQEQTGDRRAAAFHTLRLTLALHETAEEQVIHPQALQHLGARERAATDRIFEEQTAGQTIGSLEMVDVDSDQFNSTFGHLATSVTEHAAAEEADEWPALRGITDPAVINAMLEQMGAVPKLAEDPSAPGVRSTFSEMRDWAKAHLPGSPAS